MGFTSVFGGTPVYPSAVSYLNWTLSANVQLTWALESQPSAPALAGMNDVTATAPGFSFTMPDARQGTPGDAFLFNNYGTNSFNLLDNTGALITNVASGAAFVIYPTTNNTQAGAWRALMYGAIPLNQNPSSLAGKALRAIGITLNSISPIIAISSNYPSTFSDLASTLLWTAAGSGSITLTAAGTLGTAWYCRIKNAGAGTITVTPLGGLIDGVASIPLGPNDSCLVETDGTNFYTTGRTNTNSAASTFQFLSINVAGNTDVILSAGQQKPYLRFTGLLTGNINIIVPSTVAQWNIENSTTGAFSLTVKTAAGGGITVVQGGHYILNCDGTNVNNADTGSIATPIAISQGGTNATTANQALLNLGGSSTGVNVFTSSSPSNARATLGSGTVGDQVFTSVTAAQVRGFIYADERTPVADTNYSQIVTDKNIAYTSITAARQVQLLAANAVNAGFILWVTDESGNCSGTKTITLARASADLINGNTTAVISTAYGYIAIESNGNNAWTVVDAPAGGISGVTNSQLANMAAHTLKVNNTAGSATPTDATLTATIDADIGSTRGTLLERGAAGWQAIGPGTLGQVLASGGAGADPAFATFAGPVAGVTDGSNAAAGMVGEIISATWTGVSQNITGTAQNNASISLTAGDWDLWATTQFNPSGALIGTANAWMNTVSVTQPSVSTDGFPQAVVTNNNALMSNTILSVNWRRSVAGATTVFASSSLFMSSGTCTAAGAIVARRRR